MDKRISIVSDFDPLFPMQAFFNAIGAGEFVDVIEGLLNGVGRGLDGVDCDFPGDLDPGEPRFDGVRFSLYEDVVIAGCPVFRQFLVEACRAHVREHPEDKQKLESLLLRWGTGLLG
ncbi:hypothetical protein KRR26_07420 [Corallococcus sp. M34]|uniref:ribonuclease toxin immunity protein CdiI n=1 Tax=Citreicoccus inhibens TaxID=2849499 RepID=UPI001C23FDDF|nr:ribonuclease toxin immunity protein CdiI [Citreicoccus inhibens]MBU8895428.1 hypothetical protein [Citreicoccus inhibens]